MVADMTLRLALFERQALGQLIPLLRSLQEQASILQLRAASDAVRELTTYIHLLDTNAGNPADSHHPARQELRRRPANLEDVDSRFDAHLLLLDYRLACLRYAAGIAPVDDLYYTRPQQTPAAVVPSDPVQFAMALRKVRAAIRWAMQHAERLDGMLECDWRQREVAKRVERVEEIAGRVAST
jgi:hypothetical protein